MQRRIHPLHLGLLHGAVVVELLMHAGAVAQLDGLVRRRLVLQPFGARRDPGAVGGGERGRGESGRSGKKQKRNAKHGPADFRERVGSHCQREQDYCRNILSIALPFASSSISLSR